MTVPAPWLVLAVGNPSRGDDALGPLLVDRLRDIGVERANEVELRAEYQLQVEHALDIDGRRGVLFVDAARAGVAGLALARVAPRRGRGAFTHALEAPALLEVVERVAGLAPPAWLLAIEGERFELGEGLSPAAARRLDDATAVALQWLRERAAATADQPNCLVSMYSAEISDHQSSARPLST